MNPFQIGYASELLVASDLTKRGYDVYLGFLMKFDLIAIKEDRILKVEVKTITRKRFDSHRVTNDPDLIALVSHEGEIRYLKNNP